MQNDLVFDVGAHKGEDTAFYLAKGYRVIAIEANLQFCKILNDRFKDEIADGRLTVLNGAIAEHTGKIELFMNTERSVWGTTKPELVDAYKLVGFNDFTVTQVECFPLSDVVKEFGAPYYCKIDIEGADMEALASFAGGDIPKFISIESNKTNWQHLLREFDLFQSLGFRRFKVVDQSLVPFQSCPEPALEGKYVDCKFEEGCSGLFGEEAPGRWTTAPEAIERYRRIFYGYALNGDGGLFSGGRKSAFNMLGSLQQQIFRLKGHKKYNNPSALFPPPGWYDTHAAR